MNSTRRRFLAAAGLTAGLAGCTTIAKIAKSQGSFQAGPEPALYAKVEYGDWESLRVVDVWDRDELVSNLDAKVRVPVEWANEVSRAEDAGRPTPTPPPSNDYLVRGNLQRDKMDRLPTTLLIESAEQSKEAPAGDLYRSGIHVTPGEWTVTIISRGIRLLPGFRLTAHGLDSSISEDIEIGSFRFKIAPGWEEDACCDGTW